MSRKKVWDKGEFSVVKLKVENEKKKRYQKILKIKNKNLTMQDDLNKHIDDVVGE